MKLYPLVIYTVLCAVFCGGCDKKQRSFFSRNSKRGHVLAKRSINSSNNYNNTDTSIYHEQPEMLIDPDTVKQFEARLIDVSIPLQAKALKIHEGNFLTESSSAMFLVYSSLLSMQEIRAFFATEMERLGWNMTINVQNVESLMVFLKPSKFCVLSLRTSYIRESENIIAITYGNRLPESMA